jgi:hypothetical protein
MRNAISTGDWLGEKSKKMNSAIGNKRIYEIYIILEFLWDRSAMQTNVRLKILSKDN